MRRFIGFAFLVAFVLAIPIGVLRLLFLRQFVRSLAAVVAMAVAGLGLWFGLRTAGDVGPGGFNLAVGTMLVVGMGFPLLVGAAVIFAPRDLQRNYHKAKVGYPLSWRTLSDDERRARRLSLPFAALSAGGALWSFHAGPSDAMWVRVLTVVSGYFAVYKGLLEGFLGFENKVRDPYD